jgi:hypothetical protein
VAAAHFVALLFQFRRGYLFAVDVAAAVLTVIRQHHPGVV